MVPVQSTTQDFVAATGHPSWAAGATDGTRIQLQPLAVRRRRGVLGAAVRHEHALIESLGWRPQVAPPKGDVLYAATHESTDDGKPPITLAAAEQQHIVRVLSSLAGNRERAAAVLGISERTLYRKLREYQTQLPDTAEARSI